MQIETYLVGSNSDNHINNSAYVKNNNYVLLQVHTVLVWVVPGSYVSWRVSMRAFSSLVLALLARGRGGQKVNTAGEEEIRADGGCGRSILGQYGTGLEGAGRSIWQE